MSLEQRSHGRRRGAIVAVGVGVLAVVALLLVLGPADGGAPAPPEADQATDLADLGLTTDVPRTVTRSCVHAARLAKREVPCLTVVPEGRTTRNYVCRLAGCAVKTGSGWVADLHARRGRRAPVHWLIGSGRRRQVCRSIISRDLHAPVRRRQVQIAGRRAQLLKVPRFDQGGGVHGGHRVALWPERGRTWFVSIHGRRNAAVRELAAGWMRALDEDGETGDETATGAVGCR